MIKTTNKITALIIAATSMMSLVPAMAADSTRLTSKEGTIEDAVVFKDGKYIYEGYKTDADNKSVYYNNGENDKEINNLTDATLGSKYNNDSVVAFDGSDEYLVNLSDGKVTDQDVASDLKSTAENKLANKLEKTDRYGSNVSTTLEKITPNQFGDVWYSYTGTKKTVDSTGTKAIVTVNIPAAKIGQNLTIAGKTFGAPYVGSVPDFKAVKVNAAASDDADATKASKYAPLTIAGVEITTAYTTYADLTTAIGNKTLALQAAGYTVAISNPETAELAGPPIVPAYANITVTALNKGKISTAVGDYFRINSKDSFQVQVDTTSGTDPIVGYADKAALEAQIKATKFDNFTAEVTEPNATDVQVVLTQIAGKTYTQAVEGSDVTIYNNVTANVSREGTGTGVVSTGVYNGYTNATGAYIDADKTANIRVYNGSDMVKLDKFDEDVNSDGIKATVTNSTTIAQDKDYIYRIIDVSFAGSTATLKDSKGTSQITSAKYLQKISKAQGDTEKGAYLPKSVESYEITTAVSDDVTTAANKLATFVSGADKVVGLSVVDGAIYYTEMDSATKIKTYKFKLQMNEKIAATGSSSKVDAYVVKKDADVDHDLKGNAGKAGASLDVEGNLWIVNEGKILKSEKAGDFTEMFTCDRTMDSLDVYNADSLIAWTEGQDVYATVDKQTTTTPIETPVTTTGWVNTATGWTFFKADGSQVKGQWVNDGGVWYMIKADGIMATGWYNDNGTWYFLNTSGAMKTGWVLDGSTWYFLNTSGAMRTGWILDGSTWYYCNSSGAMLANTTVDGYKLNASGAWVK